MSRRGRGGRGGAAGMRGPPLPFDISPELEAYANGHGPTEDEFLNSLFPPMKPVMPTPLTARERQHVRIERRIRAKRRAGPFWTGSKAETEAYEATRKGRSVATFDPFDDVPTYGRKRTKPLFKPRPLSQARLDIRFFPKEILPYLGLDDKTAKGAQAAARKQRDTVKTTRDKLARFDEDADHEGEPQEEVDPPEQQEKTKKKTGGGDDEFDEDEVEDDDADGDELRDDDFSEEDGDEANDDYAAEKYFDGGEEDMDDTAGAGGGGGGGGGDDDGF